MAVHLNEEHGFSNVASVLLRWTSLPRSGWQIWGHLISKSNDDVTLCIITAPLLQNEGGMEGS